jgi:hypothetical protein
LRREENRRPPVAAVLALFAIAGAGCGDREIDRAKAEAFALGAIRPAPRTVSCPKGVKVEKGKTFECHVTTTDGTPATITMHIADDDGKVTVGAGDLKRP